MHPFTLKTILAAAGLALLSSSGQAATVSYNDGDLFLGIRATGGAGAATDYLVNLGSPLQLNQSFTFTLGNIGADLTSIFGSGWYSRTDLLYSVVAGAVTDNTLYATKTNATPWLRQFSQGDASSLVDQMASNYNGKTSTGNSNFAITQEVSADNSYASFQPGGSFPNSGGISFSTWAPSIEGLVSETLFLNKISEGSNGPATVVGTVQLSESGAVTYTVVPEPSAVALIGLGAGFLGFVRRRRAAAAV